MDTKWESAEADAAIDGWIAWEARWRRRLRAGALALAALLAALGLVQ